MCLYLVICSLHPTETGTAGSAMRCTRALSAFAVTLVIAFRPPSPYSQITGPTSLR